MILLHVVKRSPIFEIAFHVRIILIDGFSSAHWWFLFPCHRWEVLIHLIFRIHVPIPLAFIKVHLLFSSIVSFWRVFAQDLKRQVNLVGVSSAWVTNIAIIILHAFWAFATSKLTRIKVEGLAKGIVLWHGLCQFCRLTGAPSSLSKARMGLAKRTHGQAVVMGVKCLHFTLPILVGINGLLGEQLSWHLFL